MTDYTRHDVPADITVFTGNFASQPLVFAHLLDACPALDLDAVEVIQSNTHARLMAHFDADVADTLAAQSEGTLVLILPAAYDGLDCPLSETDMLTPLGRHRGTVPYLSTTP